MRRLQEVRLVREVKRATKSNLISNGFALIADQIPPDVTVRRSEGRVPVYTEEEVNILWSKAEKAGELEDEFIVDLYRSVVGGPVIDSIISAFKRLLEWLKDPANQEKILAIVKMIMMILLAFI